MLISSYPGWSTLGTYADIMRDLLTLAASYFLVEDRGIGSLSHFRLQGYNHRSKTRNILNPPSC